MNELTNKKRGSIIRLYMALRHLQERNYSSLRSRIRAHLDDEGTHHDEEIIWVNLNQVDRKRSVFALHTHRPQLNLQEADELVKRQGFHSKVIGIASAPIQKNRDKGPGAFIILKPVTW